MKFANVSFKKGKKKNEYHEYHLTIQKYNLKYTIISPERLLNLELFLSPNQLGL